MRISNSGDSAGASPAQKVLKKAHSGVMPSCMLLQLDLSQMPGRQAVPSAAFLHPRPCDRVHGLQGYQPGTAQTDFQINVTVTSSSNASTSSQVQPHLPHQLCEPWCILSGLPPQQCAPSGPALEPRDRDLGGGWQALLTCQAPSQYITGSSLKLWALRAGAKL